jgi:hypothetical protein
MDRRTAKAAPAPSVSADAWKIDRFPARPYPRDSKRWSKRVQLRGSNIR